MTTNRASSPRYVRPDTRPTVQITNDDLVIFWQLYRHRVMDSKTIYRLFPNRQPEKLSKRLNRLWKAEYIERIDRDNVRLRQRKGSDHFKYALAREGGKILQLQGAPEFDPHRLKQKNRQLSPISIDHMLQVTRFMVECEVSSWSHPGTRLVQFDELSREFPKATRRKSGLPLNLKARVTWHGTTSEQGTAADQIFCLETPGERQFIFLEIDRGTETIEPGNRRQQSSAFWHSSSILRKFLIYATAYRQKAHQAQYGLPVFRVLTVTTNQARVEQMQTLYHSYFASGDQRISPGFFLFTDWEAIGANVGSMLDQPFENAAGKPVHLIRYLR